MIRFAILDRHLVFRQLLGRFLEAGPEPMAFVAQGSGGREAVTLCQLHAVHLLLVDHALADRPAAEVVRLVRKELPEVRVLLMASHEEDPAHEAIKAGAHGCVTKTESLTDFQRAISVVTMGGSFFSALKAPQVRTCDETLTRRQQEMLELIAAGNSTKEVAARLGIAFKTADHHRGRLMKAVGVHDVAGLMRYAMRRGVLVV